MGKKGTGKQTPNVTFRSQRLSLREKSTGKRNTNVNANSKSMLKLEHLKNLAVWSSGEASIVSLAAFFGHHLATFTQASGAPRDPSSFTCQRCESILQPGYNCTIRIKKNRRKVQSRRQKPTPAPQNNLVYKCHFCSHRNLLRGTQKGHMKEICTPKLKPPRTHELSKSITRRSKSLIRQEPNKATPQKSEVALSDIVKDDSVSDSPKTPSVTPALTLLEAKMKKRNRSSSKKTFSSYRVSGGADAGNDVSSSNKRRRKSWTSLKEIAESSGNDGGRKLTDLTIPFSL